MRNRFNGLSPLNFHVPKLTQPVYKKRGFYEYNIIKDWPYIVGEQWAELTCPDRLSFRRGQNQSGTLYLRVYGAAALMIQYIRSEIIERANTYFGYQAIADLKIIQAGLKPEAPPPPPRNTQHIMVPELEGWEDGELKQALEQLGQSVKLNR